MPKAIVEQKQREEGTVLLYCAQIMATEARTACLNCGETTKTVGGLCPNCGVAKAGPLYGPPRRTRGWGLAEDLEYLASGALWIIPGASAVGLGVWIAGSTLLTVLGALWLGAPLIWWALMEILDQT